MKATERDELLARLDERSLNTWRTVESMAEHLTTQNGIFLEHTEQIAYNTQGRKNIKWVIGGIIFISVPLFGLVFGLLFNVSL